VFAVDLTDDAQLRPLQPWQAGEFLEHMDRARCLVDPWIPWATKSTGLESARATLQDYADKQARDAGAIYGIWLKDTLVGGVMFVTFDAESGDCEIGCWLEPAGQGRGLVTLASRRLVDWAFGVRGMRRIEWRASPRNVRSTAVARRLGMTCEEVVPESVHYRGQWHDTEIWTLRAEDWVPEQR
jgi:RimJ/RimL family protein N-acetyltransferase